MVYLEKDEEDQWTGRVIDEEVLSRVQEEKRRPCNEKEYD